MSAPPRTVLTPVASREDACWRRPCKQISLLLCQHCICQQRISCAELLTVDDTHASQTVHKRPSTHQHTKEVLLNSLGATHRILDACLSVAEL